MAPLQTWQRVAAALAMALPLGLLLVGVAQPSGVLPCLPKARSSPVKPRRCCVALRVGWPLPPWRRFWRSTVVSVLLTLTNPPGMRHLAIGVGSDHVFTLFFAATVWLMAAVIGQGQALAEENQRFV